MDLPALLSVNESFYPHEGGAEKRAFETLVRLARKGFDVKVLTNPFPDHTNIPGLEIEYVTDMNESQYFKKGSRKILGVHEFASKLRAKLKEDHEADIFMFDEFPLLPALKGASVLPVEKLKFFTWHEVLGDFYRRNGLLWKIAERWERKAANLFTNNIAVSSAVASMIENRYNVPGVSVIENGVNVRELDNQNQKNWGKIIYIGRIEPHKRVDQLITSIGKVPGVELEVIGAGSQLNHIKHIASSFSNVKVTGHLPRSQVVEKLKQSWLFAMPSNREGFSIASLEAMAASVPVITIAGQYNLAANEVIKDGRNGIIAKSFDDMSARVKMLYKDEPAWKDLSKNAHEFSLRYDWEVITEKLSKILSSSW